MESSSSIIVPSIVGFSNYARNNGLNVGIQETLDALKAAEIGILKRRKTFKYGLRSLFCTSNDEFELFDQLFGFYWEDRDWIGKTDQKRKSTTYNLENEAHTLFDWGKDRQAEEEEEGKETSGAHKAERLMKMNFSGLSTTHLDELEQLAARLLKLMSIRLSRRRKATQLRKQLNLRKTIRKSIAHGGDPIDLSYWGRKKRKPRLVLMLDVSGSMDQYSLFFVKFIYALQQQFERVESFIFSTRLTRTTHVFKKKKLPESLRALSVEADAWSSGTAIGQCFKEFNKSFGKKVLSRNTKVIILSDGLDTGAPDLLVSELKKIKLRINQLIWLNPLLGMKDYQPITRGMSAALPHLDVFIAAHNLNSLLKLERYLAYV